jgi:ribonuclease R
MVRHGELIHISKKKVRVTLESDFVNGVLQYGPRGTGICDPDDGGLPIHIHRRDMGGLMEGQWLRLLVVQEEPDRRLGVVKGFEITRPRRVFGQFKQGHRGKWRGHVVPLGKKGWATLGFPVEEGFSEKLNDGDLVSAVLQWNEEAQLMLARIEKNMGYQFSSDMDLECIVDSFGLPDHFDDAVLNEAAELPDAESAIKVALEQDHYTDMRDVPFVTVDPVDARDYDDAVFVESVGKGWRLTVAIADVSWFVPPDSEIDAEALERGTSVYFPGVMIPMLPERLCKDLCSLVPDEDRLAVVTSMEFNAEGECVQADFYNAVIRSKKRMTYADLEDAYEKGPEGTILHMRQLKDVLRQRRFSKGAIALDLSEVRFMLDDDGEVCETLVERSDEAHQTIEEFMLATNIAVAKVLSEQKVPVIYRVHDAPALAKLDLLSEYLLQFDLHLDASRSLNQAIMGIVEGARELEGKELINSQLLRHFPQAEYTVENIGHFALSETHYLHFTSPIRRYPDLIVHRQLKNWIAGNRPVYKQNALVEVSRDACRLERRALAAERAMNDLKKCRWALARVGEEHEAIIWTVLEFGFFARMEPAQVEGLVSVRTLGDDFYEYYAGEQKLRGRRHGKVYTVGQRVSVTIDGVDLFARKIDLTLSKGRNTT